MQRLGSIDRQGQNSNALLPTWLRLHHTLKISLVTCMLGPITALLTTLMCGFRRTGRPLSCENYIAERRHIGRRTSCGLMIRRIQTPPGH